MSNAPVKATPPSAQVVPFPTPGTECVGDPRAATIKLLSMAVDKARADAMRHAYGTPTQRRAQATYERLRRLMHQETGA